MDTEENSTPTEPTAEAPAPAPSPAPEAQPSSVKPSRLWPASTVIAAAIALALFSGLIGGVIGFSIASQHDRVGLVGYERGLQQGQFDRQGPFSRNPELGQRLQQFRDNHPGMQGNQPNYSQPTPGQPTPGATG